MGNTVRVLQVLDFINHNSGVSAVVMNYYMQLSEERVICDFLLYEPAMSDLEEVIIARGSKIYTTGQPNGKRIAVYRKKVEQFFSEHAGEYDIVHVHIANAAFIVLSCAKKNGVSIRIIHSHNARGADGIGKKIRNFVLNKWGICYANRYMACSVAAGAYLFGSRRCSRGWVTILNNAISLDKYRYDAEKRREIRNALGIGEETLLGHVGRFAEQKNHMELLDIFSKLCEQGWNGKLVLLGDGELQNAVEQKAEALNLKDRIIFAGVVTNVNEYMSAMDIFLLPSLFEGLPVVCVEAQAAGLPCLVSTNVTQEIALTDRVKFLDNVNTLEWCEEIERLSGALPDRTERMGMDAYDIERQARRLEEIYLQYGKSADTDVNL